MKRDAGFLIGADRLRIYWRCWTPETRSPARGQVILVHGYGEHGERYSRLAGRLTTGRLVVWALDLRGHGISNGARGVINRLDRAVGDVDGVVELAQRRNPNVPLFMLGHGMGGAIALSHALSSQRELAGLVLLAPAASLEGRSVTRVSRRLARSLSAIAPRLPVHSLDRENITRDPKELHAYMTDPLIKKGRQPVRTVSELLGAFERFDSQLENLKPPLLVLHGTADRLSPVSGSRWLVDRVGSIDKQLIEYEGFYHELLNEPPADRQRVMKDIAAWIQERVQTSARA